MNQDSKDKDIEINNILPKKKAQTRGYIHPLKGLASVVVAIAILIVMFVYMEKQRQTVITDIENATNQMSEHVGNDIGEMIDFAESSIRLVSVTIAQNMTSPILDNPAEVITPMTENTPFGGIEYIRSDGMNIMNVGEPFDASDRVYYKEGIKGNSGIWNNYHPKMSQDTLVNFYTPIIYENNVEGVVTGYVEANKQIAPLFETKIYGEEVYGILLDEDNMVVCTSFEDEYIKDCSLETFISRYNISAEQVQKAYGILSCETQGAVTFRDDDGEGIVCIKAVPDTTWRIALIVPGSSLNKIVSESTWNTVYAVVGVGIIIVLYAVLILLDGAKKRKEISYENAKLEEDNRIFNEKNQKAFAEISEIRDIISSANMGTWRIELVDNEEPRMYVDDKMKELLGVAGQEHSPERTYADWFSNITPEAVESVLKSVDLMKQGYFDENTYKWRHPKMGVRYVRCGGIAKAIPRGFSIQGYHYDVDEVVRKEKIHILKLQEAIDEKNEYYSTLGTLGGIFYSLHVIDLTKDTVVEFNARNEVKEIVNRNDRACEMMFQVMSAVTDDEYKEEALEFTDLLSIADRMKGKMTISKQFVGKHIGWFLASFITMEADKEGRPTKVIYATRIIDQEKRKEEKLIEKSQTDEMTGLLNRRAYEENIYACNDIPSEDDFVYISIDVNGLKVVNDSMGHTAGDELITGACQCMEKCFGPYGSLYRIGGDEFIAILTCDNQKIHEVLTDFERTVESWTGKLIDRLSVSYGWVSKEEEPNASVRQLGVIAEKRMYEAKTEYYRSHGVDRRGQQDAHKALCDLYTKILRINISDDSYQIINMYNSEKTKEKGFADKISEWLISFGKTGQVHPDDLDEYLEKTDLEYLRNYFAGNKTSLHVFYRRKYEDGFKQAMMEIIPANDYSDDYQSMFLYVRDIDK